MRHVFEYGEQRKAPSISGRVLVLNQSYEPVGVCGIEKAIVLLFLSKAELVASVDGRSVRSVSVHYPFPSIIRLSRWYRIPHRTILLSRKNILRRDGHRCQYCGASSTQLTVDHIIPRAQGGKDSWENLVAACLRCNNIKSNRTPEKAGMHLRTRPRRPSHVSFILHSTGAVDERWKPYLFIE